MVSELTLMLPSHIQMLRKKLITVKTNKQKNSGLNIIKHAEISACWCVHNKFIELILKSDLLCSFQIILTMCMHSTVFHLLAHQSPIPEFKRNKRLKSWLNKDIKQQCKSQLCRTMSWILQGRSGKRFLKFCCNFTVYCILILHPIPFSEMLIIPCWSWQVCSLLAAIFKQCRASGEVFFSCAAHPVPIRDNSSYHGNPFSCSSALCLSGLRHSDTEY